MDVKAAKETLNKLQEIDYGGEEILGDNFDRFKDLILFFYNLHKEFESIENFLELMPSEPGNRGDKQFTDKMALLNFTSEKLSDFQNLHSKINNTQNTLNKQIERIIQKGRVELDEETLDFWWESKGFAWARQRRRRSGNNKWRI